MVEQNRENIRKRNWWVIALISIPTFLVTLIGFFYAIDSQQDWKTEEPKWQAEGREFGTQHTARECVSESLKREQNCHEIVCANLIRSFSVACLKAAPRDEELCKSVPIQPTRKRYSDWAKKFCEAECYGDDLGCRSGLVGFMESCHPIPKNNFFPNILDESQRDKTLFEIFLAIFQK